MLILRGHILFHIIFYSCNKILWINPENEARLDEFKLYVAIKVIRKANGRKRYSFIAVICIQYDREAIRGANCYSEWDFCVAYEKKER